jgi:hypothetical protein
MLHNNYYVQFDAEPVGGSPARVNRAFLFEDCDAFLLDFPLDFLLGLPLGFLVGSVAVVRVSRLSRSSCNYGGGYRITSRNLRPESWFHFCGYRVSKFCILGGLDSTDKMESFN